MHAYTKSDIRYVGCILVEPSYALGGAAYAWSLTWNRAAGEAGMCMQGLGDAATQQVVEGQETRDSVAGLHLTLQPLAQHLPSDTKVGCQHLPMCEKVSSQPDSDSLCSGSFPERDFIFGWASWGRQPPHIPIGSGALRPTGSFPSQNLL